MVAYPPKQQHTWFDSYLVHICVIGTVIITNVNLYLCAEWNGMAELFVV